MEGNNDAAAPIGRETAEDFDGQALIGTTIAGRYEIQKRIGRGGMGVVYLAQQSALSRKVVIKVLAPNLVDDKAALARFEREARGLSRLQHPNVVTIFDFGRDNELAYIAMEYVDGHTLNRELKKNGPLTIEQFAPIAIQILKGLGEAHKLGLIHRDIKPTNIMLCELEGQPNFVKILDFGLAKLVRSPTEVTKEQHLVGSAAFLAPEQILNGVSNPRSDVYALGVLFYLMLSGKRPFKADNDAVLLYKHVNEEPPPLSRLLPEGHDIPPGVIRLIEACLRKQPEERPADANEFLARLNDTLATSLTALPWMSGEYQAVPRSGSGPGVAIDSNNPLQLSNVRLAEDTIPPGYTSVDTANPLAELSKSLAGQSVVLVAPDQGRKNIIITAIVVAVIAAIAVGTVLIIVGNNEGGEQAQDAGPDIANLQGVLDQVKTNITEQRWGRAATLLDSVEADLAKAPADLVSRGADYRDQIEIGKLLSQADRQIADGDLDGAVIALDGVLARDPAHAGARERKAGLNDRLRDAALGELAVETGGENATVFIDGRETGASPISIELEPGTYELRVEADGRDPWEKRIEITEGTTHRFAVDLKNATAAESAETLPEPPEAETDAQPDDAAAVKAAAKRRADRKRRDEKKKREAEAEAEAAAEPVAEAKDPPKETKKDEGEDSKRGRNGLLLPVKGSKDKDEEKKEERKNGGLLLPVGGK